MIKSTIRRFQANFLQSISNNQAFAKLSWIIWKKTHLFCPYTINVMLDVDDCQIYVFIIDKAIKWTVGQGQAQMSGSNMDATIIFQANSPVKLT